MALKKLQKRVVDGNLLVGVNWVSNGRWAVKKHLLHKNDFDLADAGEQTWRATFKLDTGYRHFDDLDKNLAPLVPDDDSLEFRKSDVIINRSEYGSMDMVVFVAENGQIWCGDRKYVEWLELDTVWAVDKLRAGRDKVGAKLLMSVMIDDEETKKLQDVLRCLVSG